MKRIILSSLIMLALGCGADDKDDKPSGPPDDYVKLTLWDDRALWLQDKLFKADCNQFIGDFWIEKGRKECKPVTINTTYDKDFNRTWTIQSTDAIVNKEGFQEKDMAAITFDNVEYYCNGYAGGLYNGGVFTDYTFFTIFSSQPVDKPAAIKPDNVYGIAFGEQDACDVLKK